MAKNERYELHVVELPELIKEVDRLWRLLPHDEGMREDAADAGIDVSRFADVPRPKAIRITTVAHGISGPEFFDVGFFASIPGLSVVAFDLWKKVILPRVQSRFGKDAVRRAKRNTDESAQEPETVTKKRPRTNQRKTSAKKSKVSHKAPSRKRVHHP